MNAVSQHTTVLLIGASRGLGYAIAEEYIASLAIDESIPNLVTTVDAQRGRAGLQYLDYLGQTVAW